MGAQAVAGPLDLDDDGVVQEAIEERGGDDGIAEDLAPFGEAAVRREERAIVSPCVLDRWRARLSHSGH